MKFHTSGPAMNVCNITERNQCTITFINTNDIPIALVLTTAV